MLPPPSVGGDPLMQIPTMHVGSQTKYVEIVVAPRIPWLVQWGTRLDGDDQKSVAAQ